MTALWLAIAMLLDARFGEPDWLWSRIRHPAVLMGNAVGWLDTTLNRGAGRKGKGILATALLVIGAYALGRLIRWVPDFGLLEIIGAAILLAQKSLAEHVSAVATALRQGLPEGRASVAMIVGRDTADMDEPAVARAAIESAAENLSDGVTAPVFWFLIGGLPGMLVYKAVNTADSMIGYMTDQYREFGWAAARLDDALNWIPARLTAALILLSHRAFNWDLMAEVERDAKRHRSPNAGWPEAAMARCLDVSLAGPRSYDGTLREFPYVHEDGRKDIGPEEIDASVAVLWQTWRWMLGGVGVLAAVGLLLQGLAGG